MALRLEAASESLQKKSAWRILENHYKRIRNLHLRELFANDPRRGERMTAQGVGIYLDYSKNRITDQTMRFLVQLAKESALQEHIDRMFRGEKINITENRAALHVALRAPSRVSTFVNEENVVPQVHALLDRMAHFSESVRSGEWKGYTGKRIRNVINIGIGALDAGPRMAYSALKHYGDRSMNFRFVSNADGSELSEVISDLDASETLFIVCSKTFKTRETILNAVSARSWSMAAFGDEGKSVAKHFVAVANNVEEVTKFGIDYANMFRLWDWAAERYSLCSATGLSLMLAIGPENFRAMISGFHEMDMHFMATPFERNLPVILGLLVVWYVNLFGVHAMAVLPYEHSLRLLPTYLQHLAMESNGKRSTLIGTEVTQDTAPLLWGEVGWSGQHSFYQLLHQGTRLMPCDVIAFGMPHDLRDRNHAVLLANALAQTEALAFGKTAEEVRREGTPDWLVSHRVCEGNRPSNIIFAKQLTPEVLGKLIALYEHSVFTQGVIWNINSFDQWGGELGESLAERIIPELESTHDDRLDHDSSTNTLIKMYRQWKFALQGRNSVAV